MAKLRELIRGNKGQGLVEFALVLPILLVLLFAIIDFGRCFYCWSALSNASRHGARLAVVSDLSDAGKIDAIKKSVSESVVSVGIFEPLEEGDVEIERSGDDVKCTVNGSVDLWVLEYAFKLLGSETTEDGNLPVTGVTVMLLE